ncbi:MAG TPA: zinc-dependent alcohol dehydrogenase family protein [Gammaproteobacteria bacterium]|nr:zinc-dependent alcohol dehydrogenase family protein [Gammaproteobacteria bacterium]
MPRIVRFHRAGEAEVLQIDEIPMPELGDDEVLIAVRAFGLNRAEIMFRRGEYPQYSPEFPSPIGYEAAGTVLAVGEGVSSFAPGDRVASVPSFRMGPYWSYGEVARVPVHAVAPLPDRLSFEEGAAVWMPFMTCYGALIEYGRLTAGEHLVVRAASSSVGLAAIQMAKKLGAKTIAVTRTSAKRECIDAAGADHFVASDEENMVDRILEITGGRGAEMIMDPVAGPELERLAQAIAYQGRLFVYGRLDARPAVFPVGLGLAKGLTMRGYSLFEIINFPQKFEAGKRHVQAGIAAGEYRPVVGATFAFEDIVAAHRYMESNAQHGKIVVKV